MGSTYQNKTFVGTLALILVTAAWGLSFTLIKDAVASLSPFTFVSVRFLMASLILGLFLKIRPAGKLIATSRRELYAGAFLGLLLFLGYAFQTLGLQFTSASNAGFITGMCVVFVPIFTLYMKSAKVKWNAWTGVALSVLGLSLLSFSSGQGINKGDILILFCSIAFALHIIFVGKYAETFDPFRLTWIQITICGGLSLIAAILLEQNALATLPITLLIPKVIVALSFCALFATAAAYFIQNAFQRYSTPVKTALIFTCEPVFSALFAYILGGETLQPQQIAGCLFLFCGMIVAEVGNAALLYLRFKIGLKPSA